MLVELGETRVLVTATVEDGVPGFMRGKGEGWITAEERVQLEELRAITWDAISVDDFDTSELVAASLHRHAGQPGLFRAA